MREGTFNLLIAFKGAFPHFFSLAKCSYLAMKILKEYVFLILLYSIQVLQFSNCTLRQFPLPSEYFYSMFNCHFFMESVCHIFSKYLVFQLKYLVFRSETQYFDRNTRYFEIKILKYRVFQTVILKYSVFRAKYWVFRNTQYFGFKYGTDCIHWCYCYWTD